MTVERARGAQNTDVVTKRDVGVGVGMAECGQPMTHTLQTLAWGSRGGMGE